MKRFTLCIFLTFCIFKQVIAQERSSDIFSVISTFGSDLYRIGELSGGSEAEWHSLEETATAAMILALQNLHSDGPILNEHGRTPLHEASAQGFHFLVELMLLDERGGQWINNRDSTGLTAYEYAQLAMSETILACHPDMDNPFVLMPFFVKLPYYAHSKPYPRIHKLLIEAGADTSSRSAKEFWLSRCSQSDAAVRTNVEYSEDLYSTLTEVSLAVGREKQLKDLEEQG